QQASPIVSGSAGKNAVKVVRKPLRFHERFASTVRAAVEVGAISTLPIKTLDNDLRVDGSFVHCAITKVPHLLRVSERPTGVHRRSGMAVVRPSCCVSPFESSGHGKPGNRPRKAAV